MRKLLVVFMALFAFSSIVSAAPGLDMTVVDKTAAVEKIFYGLEQTGSLVERSGKLEKDIYGIESKDALMAKVDKAYSYAKENSIGSPSFLMKLNAVEWSISRGVTNAQSAKIRLENMERMLLGNAAPGSFDERMNNLLKLTYVNGQFDIVATTISKDTLIRIKMVTPLNSRTAKVGDAVVFQAVDDVYIGGDLVIAKGAQGIGKVEKVEQAQNFGRDAKLAISFDTLDTIDGNAMPIFLGDKAKEETKSLAKTAGATVAGLVILGPVGVIGGAFVHGQDANIPAGSELFVQAKNDKEVFGIITK